MEVTGEQVMFAWTVPNRPSAVRVARMPLNRIR
jgi:hypothetical protein